MMSLEEGVVRKAASVTTSAYDVDGLGEATLGKLRDERNDGGRRLVLWP